ncbi:MAG: hypothetical protein E5W56_07575, partial [Mesorhizobium sp.]
MSSLICRRKRRRSSILPASARRIQISSSNFVATLPGKAAGQGLRGPTAVSTLFLTGCSDWQSTLHAHGANARKIFDLIWTFGAVALTTWLLVMLALAMALFRRHLAEAPRSPLQIDSHQERRLIRAVGSATALTVVVLIALTIGSFFAGKSIASLSGSETVTVRVTGHQWWWEIRYPKIDSSEAIVTANEIHIPVGESVKVKLDSLDVIHSFWVPSLAGKRDLIPGRSSELTL